MIFVNIFFQQKHLDFFSNILKLKNSGVSNVQQQRYANWCGGNYYQPNLPSVVENNTNNIEYEAKHGESLV